MTADAMLEWLEKVATNRYAVTIFSGLKIFIDGEEVGRGDTLPLAIKDAIEKQF